MFKFKSIVLPILVLMLIGTIMIPINALEVTVDPTTQFCFSSDDFTTAELDDGVFITAVPSANIANVRYGERVLKAGDALTLQALDSLILESECVTQQTAAVEYCTISDGKITGTKSLKISIHPKKNDVPIAKSDNFETYKNIANTGVLKASDPEGSQLSYTIVDQPKRGTVELGENGSFTYTPQENKVGNDSFTFTVTDDAGNTSEIAKISVKIKKPTDKATYADMTGDVGHFQAMWLKENDIFTGSTIAGTFCFSPEQTVNRGEFLIMVMKLLNADCITESVSAGFADQRETPSWMQPYITTALSNGMISGTSTDDGVVFRPTAVMTKAEAAVMLQNILELPLPDTAAVFSFDEESYVPVWAYEACSALSNAGISLQLSSEDDVITRRDAADILYKLHKFLESSAADTFYWVQ